MKVAVSSQNAALDAIDTDIGTSAKIKVYSGAAPAALTDAPTGTLLLEYDLASDWAANASGGEKVLNDLPLSEAALADWVEADLAYFRLLKSDGTTQKLQGTVTSDGSGDLQIDTDAFSSGATVKITFATLQYTDV